jgi:hypothetical protein
MSRDFDNSAADRLIELAYQHFRFGQDLEREPFAVPKRGPNVAMFINCQEQDAFKAFLAKDYRNTHRKTPSKSQLADAIQVLVGDCFDADPEPCFRRVAPCPDGGIAVDLGRADGRTVLIYPNGPVRWRVADRSPVLFHRTPLMAAMPVPVEGGCLDEIPKSMGLTERQWTLVLGWILAAYERDIPHPILAIFGPAGAGKSFLAKLVVNLSDPSPAPLKSAPHSEEDWHLAASSSWVYAMDNLSEIKTWLADALCKAATGDARAVRRLYSTKSLTVTSLKLPVILTGIEVGALRSDFGDRLVMLELPRRQAKAIALENDLQATIQQRLPIWLGALFDAVSRVLEVKPFTRTPMERPRMADFSHVLACADAAGVTVNAVEEYARNRQDTAQEVAEGDELVESLARLLQETPEGHWHGSATELLQALDERRGSQVLPAWPKAPNQLSRRLKRLEPVLKDCGVRYAIQRDGNTRRKAVSLSLFRKGNSSFASFAEPDDPGETREKCRVPAGDGGAMPGRCLNDGRAGLPASPDDARTMPERWPAICDPRSKPVRLGDPNAPGTIDRRASDLTACPKCYSANVVDVAIHKGESLRRECAECGAFLGFSRWYGTPRYTLRHDN